MRCACFCSIVTAKSALHDNRHRSHALYTISCELLVITFAGTLDCALTLRLSTPPSEHMLLLDCCRHLEGVVMRRARVSRLT